MKKLAMAAGLALTMGMSATAMAHPTNSGYVTDSGDSVWRTGFGGCWHTGFWSQENATVEGCDGYKKMAPKAAEPAPVAPAKAKAPEMMDVSKKFAVFFDFDSAVVDSVSNIVDYVNGLQKVNTIRLVGHADSIGSSAYNDALSKRRAENVAAALRSAGVGASMNVDYMGETAPIAQCSGRGAELIRCLRADRRVDVHVGGKK